jgi:hypothetical protein
MPDIETTDLVARLREAARRGKPDGHMMLATNELRAAAAEIERLRDFVQTVANCSNDPGIVNLAYENGARP